MGAYTGLEILIDPDPGVWENDNVIDAAGLVEAIAITSDATMMGKPAVSILIRLPSGKAVVGHTTLALFMQAGMASVGFHQREGLRES
jgi:hypothetical protein